MVMEMRSRAQNPSRMTVSWFGRLRVGARRRVMGGKAAKEASSMLGVCSIREFGGGGGEEMSESETSRGHGAFPSD
jgi:hypothetical protein